MEQEAIAALDGEASVGDGCLRIADEMAAAEHARPQRDVKQALQLCQTNPRRAHMLVEAKLAIGADDPGQLGESQGRLGPATTPACIDASASGRRCATPAMIRTGTAAWRAASTARARRFGSGSTATTSVTLGG